MPNKFTIDRIQYHFGADVDVKAIRDAINSRFPGKKWAGVRKEIWSTILRGGRCENLVYFIAFSFREVAEEHLRAIDAVVDGTMDVMVEPPRRIR